LNSRTKSLLCAIALCSPATVSADEPDDVVYWTCDDKASWIAVSAPGYQRDVWGAKAEPISIDRLVTYSEADDEGNRHRSGVRSMDKMCGQFTVRITGGYLNSNFQGELGASEIPLVEIFVSEKKLVGPIAIGECTSTVTRFSVLAECPNEWAVEVGAFYSPGSNGPVVHLKRVHDEFHTHE
jgi:hypothetical protein